MRALVISIVLVTSATAAQAWDGPELWYGAATGASPGGGGIFGTGGARDHNITCLDCHVDRVENGVTLDLRFQPALTGATGASFTPGQRYRVDARLLGETLGPPCDPYMTHTNNFAAVFEDDAGAIAGLLESDSGQSAAACPPQYTRPTTGTTALYGDCQVIFSKGNPDLAAWSFFWTAPAGGTVHLHYGAVDGDCSMSSMGDAAVSGSRTLSPAAAKPRTAWRVLVSLLP